MIRRPPRSTRVRSSAASDVYKRQPYHSSNGVAGQWDRRSCLSANGPPVNTSPPVNRQATRSPALLYFYGRACVSEFLLDGLGFFLVHAFFDRLGSAIHQV